MCFWNDVETLEKNAIFWKEIHFFGKHWKIVEMIGKI